MRTTFPSWLGPEFQAVNHPLNVAGEFYKAYVIASDRKITPTEFVP
jgi:hypothetical protein